MLEGINTIPSPELKEALDGIDVYKRSGQILAEMSLIALTLKHNPQIIAEVIRDNFRLDVEHKRGDAFDASKITVSLRDNAGEIILETSTSIYQ